MSDDFDFSDYSFEELNRMIDSVINGDPLEDLSPKREPAPEDRRQAEVASAAAAALSAGTEIPRGNQNLPPVGQAYRAPAEPKKQEPAPIKPDFVKPAPAKPEPVVLPAQAGNPAASVPAEAKNAAAPMPAAAEEKKPEAAQARAMTDSEVRRVPIRYAGEPEVGSEEWNDTIKVDLGNVRVKKPEKGPQRLREIKRAGDIGPYLKNLFLRIVQAFRTLRPLKAVGYALSFVLGCLVVGILVLTSMIRAYEDPTIDNLFANRSLDYTTVLYAPNEETGEFEKLEELFYDQNREWVNLEDIPQYAQDALISIEDERFYQHDGVDWRRFGGAFVQWLAGSDSYGGSTITQQLIKNLTGETDRTWQRKAQEIFRALYVEKKYQKTEILEYYLNTVYFNYRAYGISKASELYFNKTPQQLTVAESAALISIVNLPSYYEPYGHPENNQSRRELVLYKMHSLGKLTDEEYEAAINEQITFNPNGQDMALESTTNWFTDTVIADVLQDLQRELGYSEYAATQYLYSGGLQIYTTVNRKAQKALEEAYKDPDNFPDQNTDYIYQSACMLVDPKTGHVLAVAGGRGEKNSRDLNRAISSQRQPGSAIKPLSVYLPALNAKVITEGTVVDDAPVTFMNGAGYPQNAALYYYGKTTIYSAIRNSLNASAAQVLTQLGFQNSYDFLTKNLHFDGLVGKSTDSDGDVNMAALSMGAFNYGVYLRDMVGGYSAIAAGGVYREPITYTSLKTPEGRLIIEKDETGEQAFSVESAWLMQDLLRDSAQNGIAYISGFPLPLAGKTGTTTNNHDKYYMGFTPYFAFGVWVGYDTPENLVSAGVSSSVSRIVTSNVLSYVIEQVGWSGGEFAPRPSNLVQASYCLDCGKAPSANCLLDLRGERIGTAWYIPGTQPSEACTCHVPVYICDASGMIAHDGCTSAHLASMINVVREYGGSVSIDDAQYVYRPVPDGTPLSLDDVVFANLLPAGRKPGYSTDGGVQNHLCTAHERSENPQLYNPNRPFDGNYHTVHLPQDQNGCTVSPSGGVSVDVNEGDDFLFTLSNLENNGVPVVLCNGAQLEPESTVNGNPTVYTYRIEKISEDCTITYMLVREGYVSLILPSGVGYTVTSPTSYWIARGGSVTFTVRVQEGYTLRKVYANSDEISGTQSGNSYIFRLTDLQENVRINVVLDRGRNSGR